MATVIERELPTQREPAELVEQVRSLCDQGLFLQAYRASQELGPLSAWTGTTKILLAARLAVHLAAPTLGNWLMRRAWKFDPADSDARFYNALRIFRRRGPYWAWRWTDEMGEPDATVPPEHRARWLALRGSAAAALRDFATAESLMDRALEIEPDSSYARLCRAGMLEQEDRYADALEAALAVVKSEPNYAQAIECVSHLYTLLDRDQDAIDLLTEASARLESGSLLAMLHVYQMELKLYDQARRTLEQWVEYSPLAEKGLRKWVEAQRSELAYHCGDYPAAIEHAEASGLEFFKAVAERLRDPHRASIPRTELGVGFVRQHRVTCVPATLSAISRFWLKPADHVQVAEEICYNGTSNYSERQWACRNGWLAREFTVTEEATRALVERGIPFTFNTVEPMSGHLQAVIGYDGRRGTLLIREPSSRVAVEALADKILHRYRAFGPRGMAIVPEEHAARLDGVELPDAQLWDRLHALDGALERHCREQAQEIYRRLLAESPNHRITHDARRRLAIYDANSTERLEAVKSLLQTADDDPCLQMEQLGCLRGLSKREERLPIFAKICSAAHPHPAFLQQYAEELRVDARQLPEAARLARRAVRRMPVDGGSYHVLACVYWDQRRFAEALELYRFAACLHDKEEAFARSYFVAAQWFKKTEEALGFLRTRFERYGVKSFMPARTLVSALLHLNRTSEAMETIEHAIRLRPDDAELALFAAKTYATLGSRHFGRAKELLTAVESNAPRGEWLRSAAELAESEGRRDEALGLWQELLQTQPLAMDAHVAVATLLAEQQGRAAGLAHLEQAVTRFPHYQPLSELWAQRLAEEPAPVREPILRRLIEANPEDGWLHRELGFLLAGQRRAEEAWQEAEISLRLEPNEGPTHHLRSLLLKLEGRIDEAKDALRRAIVLSVDNTYAGHALLDLCDTLAERRETLDFLRDELRRQVVFGDGLICFREAAHGTLDAEDLLAVLQEAVRERPDLWHAWSAVTRQLMNMERLDEAWQAIRQATERYPLLPRLWLDQADIAHAHGDEAEERRALETACQINPRWGEAVRSLCNFLQRRGELQAARERLEQLVAYTPSDAAGQGMLAELLWRLGERDEALERVRHVAGIAPGYRRVWECLNAWASELNRRDVALEAARALTRQRGAEARSWLIAAEAYNREEELDERLAALDKAIELNPECTDAYDLRVRSLAAAGRWDEAAAACRPAAFGENPPIELRARSAWLAAQRGDRAAAIAQMRAVVADAPALFDAWSSLHQWSHESQDGKGSLEAAEAMVRIAPHYEYGYGCLGEARVMCKDAEGAIAAYRRAVELNPAYEFAGNALFDIYMEKNDLKAAAATLAGVQEHSQSAYVLCRAVQLATRQRNFKAAGETLCRLCVTKCPGGGPIDWAADTMVKAGWSQYVRDILEEAAGADGAHPEVVCKWARLCAASGDGSFARWFARRADQEQWADDAVNAYLDTSIRAKKQQPFTQFVNHDRKCLHARSLTWGMVGYGMAVFRLYRQGAKWFADWRQRGDVEPWMLVNAVEAFWAVGKYEEMRAVGEHAVALPDSPTHNLHHLLLAAGALIRDDLSAARSCFQRVVTEKLSPDYAFVAKLMQSILEMQAAAPAQRSAVFRQARARLAGARRDYKDYMLEPARRRLYRQCLRQAARLRGGIAAWLWYSWWWINS